MSSLPPPVADAAPTGVYTCPYCRLASDASGSSCPHCGAPVDIRAKVSASGWERQPPIRDMAHIQFGQSTCQVSGTYVPVAEMRLAAGDRVYFSHHMLLWADTQVQLAQQQLKGAWGRMMAGMPLVMMEAHGPGTVAFSDNHAGETIAVPLVPGRTIDVREHRFLVATGNVAYDWFQSNVWYTTRDGDETETHYPLGMMLDRFSAAERPGLMLLHSPGNVFVRDLAAGETICIHPGSFIWKDTTAGMQLHLERPRGRSWLTSWQPCTPFLRVWGPGRVAVSSVFERMEKTGSITRTSQATMTDWNNVSRPSAIAGVGTGTGGIAAKEDTRVTAALTALAGQHGFEVTGSGAHGPLWGYTFQHPGGIDVRVDLASGGTAASIAATVGNLLGGPNTSVAAGVGKLLGGLAKAAGKMSGQPVEGFGDEAHWRPGEKASDLTATKGDHHVHVRVTAAMPPEQHYGWAGAFMLAALGAL